MRLHHQGYRPVQRYFNYLGFDILSFQLHSLFNEMLLQQQLSVINEYKSNPIARIIKFLSVHFSEYPFRLIFRVFSVQSLLII